LGFGLDSSRSQNLESVSSCLVGGGSQDGGLTDAWFTANHERIAMLFCARDQSKRRLDFALTSVQGRLVGRAFGRHVGIMGATQRAAVSPPSITKSAPVMFPVRLLASINTRVATSAGCVNRPVIACLATRSATSYGSAPVARPIVAATPSLPSHCSVATGPG